MSNFFEKFWYKDLMDVYQPKDVENSNNPLNDISLTEQEWKLVFSKIPCKVYRTSESELNMTETSGEIQESNKVSWSNKYKLKEGYQIYVWQYGEDYGDIEKADKYILGKPKRYKEPFGGVKPGLEHSQATITLKERVIQ